MDHYTDLIIKKNDQIERLKTPGKNEWSSKSEPVNSIKLVTVIVKSIPFDHKILNDLNKTVGRNFVLNKWIQLIRRFSGLESEFSV